MSYAPNLTPQQRAAVRLELAAKIASASADVERFEQRERAAAERSSELAAAQALVVQRRGVVSEEIRILVSLAGKSPDAVDATPAVRGLSEALEELNEIDGALGLAAEDVTRTASELGTARAESAKARETLDGLRRRLLDLVA